jgi:hypothetical protein
MQTQYTMIKDQNIRAEIKQGWDAVRALTGWSSGGVASGGCGGVLIVQTPPEQFYNLPLVLAYSVLDDVLGQMIIENIFKCAKKNGYCYNLGDKMQSSKGNIMWKDYATVNDGRNRRNEVAHKGVLHSEQICRQYINAVEDELKNWRLFV